MPAAPLDPRLRAVGTRMRALRLAYGLNQSDVAQRLGMTRSSIANMEGGRQNPTLLILFELAEALDVTIGALVGEVDMPELEKLVQTREEVLTLETQARDVTKRLIEARARLRRMTPE